MLLLNILLMISADYLIIGTGPVGVFTAKYLLEKIKRS